MSENSDCTWESNCDEIRQLLESPPALSEAEGSNHERRRQRLGTLEATPALRTGRNRVYPCHGIGI